MEIEDIENESFFLLHVWKQIMLTFQIYCRTCCSFCEFWLKPIKESRLKFVAQFENGKASVGLHIHPKRPSLYNLKEKTISYCSLRTVMSINPIDKAGAGAEVTASGIFADVIRIGNVKISLF
jgi:aspartokinase/homoserine dehydrogenase 1